jgi:hypothetical protein
MAGPIDPSPRRLTYFVDQIQIPAVLGDKYRAWTLTVLDASILAGKIYTLCPGIRGRERTQCGQCNQACFHHHKFSDLSLPLSARDAVRY